MTTRKQGSARTKTGQFKPGVTGNPKGRPHKEARARADSSFVLAPPVAGIYTGIYRAMMDGWNNTTTGLGVSGKDKSVNTDFCMDLVSGEGALEIWRGDPIGARIVETPPNEAIRQGFELCIGDDELPESYKPPEPAQPDAAAMGGSNPDAPRAAKTDVQIRNDWARKHPSAFTRRVRKAIARGRMDAGDAKPLQEKISKKLQDLGAALAIREALCYERAGGGGAIMLGANDYTTDLRIPLDLKKVRSLDYLSPLEARELIPLFYYNDPMQPKYGQVAIFQLIPYTIGAPVDGYSPRVTQIHETRLLVFPGIRVSRRIMQTATLGWGDSVFTRCVRALRAFNVGHQSAETLLSDFAQAVYKIKGLADVMSKNQNALTDAMMNVELGRSICRAIVIDADEEFERKSTTMTGYPETLDRLALNLASAADMPMTLLLGQSPAGMDATGASDIRFFYDRISSMQTLRVAPALLRIIEILIAVNKQNPDNVNHSIKFHPLWQPTQKEIADAHYVQAQADALYITNDVCSAEEIALSRFGGDAYSYETRIDFEARQSQESVVAPTVNAKPTTIPAPNAFEYSPDPNQASAMPKNAGDPTTGPSRGATPAGE